MLRLAFMGTPDFAVPALSELIAAGHEIAAVYTQPPRPAGRGQKPQASPVERFAREAGLLVRAPESLKTPEAQAEFASLDLDAAVVVAYGLILPRAILDAPRLGCFNIHASLLPRWRGAAPIQRAILAGDSETGVAIMRMEAGLDTGPVALMERAVIGPRENAGSLHDRLSAIGASLIVRALSALERGSLSLVPQPQAGVTYAAKIDKSETRLDWHEPAAVLDRKVCAFAPHPGAWFAFSETRIRVLAAEPVAAAGEPGTVLDDALTIACGQGALRLLTVQRAGKAPMSASEFLRGTTIAPGTKI
jgi:methionyl-tRNA formyltransferase